MPITKAVDIPSPPACITGEPGELQGEKINIHTIDKRILSGSIEALSHIKNSFAYKSADTQSLEVMEYTDINYIAFSKKLCLKADLFHQEPQASEEGDFLEHNPFYVDFNSGTKLDGEVFTSIEMEKCLHLFIKTDSNTAQRLYIPKTNISEYRLGLRLGEVLLKQQNIPEDAVKTGLDQQQDLRAKLLGSYFTENNIVSKNDLQDVLKKQKITAHVKIGSLLVSEGLITEEQLDQAINLQKGDHSKKIGDLLIEIGAVKQEPICRAIATKLGIPFVNLKNFDVDSEATSLIPAQIAIEHEAMPIALNNGQLVVAVANPSNTDILNILSFISNRSIELVISTSADIKETLDRYYSTVHYSESEMEEVVKDAHSEDTSGIVLTQLANERPIVRLVNQIFADASSRSASDIHIRPKKKEVELLYRINGVMVHVRNLGKSLLPAITSRIKILAKMDITERRLPQDGRIQSVMKGRSQDMRISIVPTVHGESTAIRLLTLSGELRSIDKVGFNARDIDKFKELLHRGGGIILVTGPTGSGKTTTLYSAINELRKLNLNIITIEDPVEIQLDGIEQIQVDKKIDFTFAKALKNILRHDPDVIMLGEIRDEESAKIAIQCAQTGHLVLSTLHTNTAAGTISRLKQMGIPGYLIASTVLGVISQRLLKRNCPHCQKPEIVTPSTRKILNLSDDDEFYQGHGCSNCNDTGYIGRLPVYELMIVNENIKEVVINDGSEIDIQRSAIEDGLETIVQNALIHAKATETSIQEVHRVYST